MKQTNQMDERQIQITLKAMGWGGLFLGLCVVASMIYKIIVHEDGGWEFWALLGTAFVIGFTRKRMGDVDQPLDLFNKPLPTGSSKKERLIRIKDYILQSLVFAAGYTVLDILLITFGKDETTDLSIAQTLFPNVSMVTAVVITAVITFVSIFVISCIIEYLAGELYTIPRYNKMLAELDGDEDA